MALSDRIKANLSYICKTILHWDLFNDLVDKYHLSFEQRAVVSFKLKGLLYMGMEVTSGTVNLGLQSYRYTYMIFHLVWSLYIQHYTFLNNFWKFSYPSFVMQLKGAKSTLKVQPSVIIEQTWWYIYTRCCVPGFISYHQLFFRGIHVIMGLTVIFVTWAHPFEQTEQIQSNSTSFSRHHTGKEKNQTKTT